jgi:hypothetical protein
VKTSAAVANPAQPEVVHPPPISLAELWPWTLFALALLLLLYFVGLDEGAASLVGGSSVHEWVHDGRHLLGFACH